MAIRATPSEVQYHTHILSLSDGVTTIGINPVNSRGEPDIRTLQRQPYPRGTLAVGNASGQLSERRAPFGEFSRNDWSGGIGMDDGEKDATRYWFARHVSTHIPGKVVLAPLTYFCKLPTAATNHMGQFSNRINLDTSAANISGESIQDLSSGGLYDTYAIKISSVPANTIVTGVVLIAEHTPSTAPVTVHNGYDVRAWMETDNAGSPSGTVAVAAASNQNYSKIGVHDLGFVWTKTTLAAGDYWLVVQVLEGTYSFKTLANSSYTVKWGINDTDWTNATKIPLFEIQTSAEWSDAKFFKYKNQQYLAAQTSLFDTSRTAESVQIFENGYRGSADSNAGNLDYLIDATQTFDDLTTSSIIRVSETSNNGEYLWRMVESILIAHQVKATLAWLAAHSATTTEYVIENTLTWRELTGHGATKFRDVAVTDNGVVYLAQGETVNIRRWREYNNSGTWTLDAAADGTNKANLLLPAYDQKLGHVLWRARNTGTRRQVSKAPTQDWGTDLTFATEIGIGGQDETITGMIIYDGKLAVFQTGSIWMILNDVPDKLSANLKSATPTNGKNPEIVPPYMVLPYGNGIERLYNNLLEDFGPEKDAGLPNEFGGISTDSETIPGGLLMCKDGGQSPLDLGPTWHIGNVFLYRNGGWHPVMELPLKWHPLAITKRPMENSKDMLWCATKRGLAGMFWPREFDYTVHGDQINHYEPDGYLITGWFDAGSVVLNKWWDRITIHADGLSSSARVAVYYRTSEDGYRTARPDDTRLWTYAGITTGTTSQQEIDLSVTSKKIQFFIRLIGDYSTSPVLLGYNVEYLARVKSAAAYPINIRLTDLGVDREGTAEALGTSAMADQLDAWADSITPLTMRCIREPYDNKRVLIERPGLRPAWLDAPMDQAGEYASLSIIEVKTI